MSHLGSRLSAFVDGCLGAEEAERVMAHVAACGACADQLAAEREARRALSSAADVVPEPDLTARLLAMRPPPVRPEARRWYDSAGFADSVPLPGERSPGVDLRGEVVLRRRTPALLGVAGCLALLVAGLVALGDRATVSPQVTRTYALRVLAQAVDGTQAPSGAPATVPGPAARAAAASLSPTARPAGRADDVASSPAEDLVPAGELVLSGADAHAGAHEWLTEHGWVAPEGLPAGWTVEAVRRDVHRAGDLEMDLDGPHGTVVVVQQRGRLADRVVADLPTLDVAGRTVHVASRDPWHVLWQCDDVVVSVFAEGQDGAVRDIVAAHPALAYDDGVPARIARGWAAVAGAWAP